MSFRPQRALVRPPSARFAEGLTTQSLGSPDLARARAQHAAYVEALGLEAIVLPADDRPDSCFVEDTALVLDGFVVVTRPGHPEREAECESVASALRKALPEFELRHIEAPGRVDGGDVLRMGDRWFVGLSSRTDRAGFEQLRSLVPCEAVPLEGLLHLKTGVGKLDDETVLALPGLDRVFRDLGFEVVRVAPEDWHAANVVALGRRVVMPAGHPRVAAAVRERGLEPVEVDLGEFKKQDGGATCLSILLPV